MLMIDQKCSQIKKMCRQKKESILGLLHTKLLKVVKNAIAKEKTIS